jgi:hypothetical protein
VSSEKKVGGAFHALYTSDSTYARAGLTNPAHFMNPLLDFKKKNFAEECKVSLRRSAQGLLVRGDAISGGKETLHSFFGTIFFKTYILSGKEECESGIFTLWLRSEGEQSGAERTPVSPASSFWDHAIGSGAKECRICGLVRLS